MKRAPQDCEVVRGASLLYRLGYLRRKPRPLPGLIWRGVFAEAMVKIGM